MGKLYTADNFVTIGGTTAQYVTGAGTLVTFPPIPSGADYIQNQIASAQSANMWISGSVKTNSGLLSNSLNSTTYPYDLTLGTSNADVGSVLITTGSTAGYVSSIYVGGGSAPNPNTLLFTTASSERMRISTNGNVGIGTTSPTTILSVVKTETFNGYTDFVQLADNTNGLRISDYWDSNGIRWDLRRGTTPMMSFSQSNNVGIGTTNPRSKLQVGADPNFTIPGRTAAIYGTADSETIFSIGRSGLDYPQLLDFGVNYAGLYSTISARQFTVASENNLILQPNGGNVGIGTTTPNNKLSVAGNVELVYGTGSKIGFNVNDSFAAYSTSIAHYGMSYGSNAEPLALSGYFGLGFFTTGGERMCITSTGNVGIGTTNPGAKLHIQTDNTGNQIPLNIFGYRTAATADVARLASITQLNSYGIGVFDLYNSALNSAVHFAADGDSYINPQNSGNVGIGTTSPNFPLQVNGKIAGQSFISSTNSNYEGNRLEYGTYGSQYGWKVFTDGANVASFFNDRSLFTGNVGIGTTSPAAKLQIEQTGGTQLKIVSGDAFGAADVLIDLVSAYDSRGRGILYSNSTDGNKWFSGVPYTGGSYSIGYGSSQPEYLINSKFFISTAGNVGIGTTSPGYKLDVNGTVNIIGSFGNRGVEDAYRLKFYDNGGTANDVGIGVDGFAGGGEQMWFNSLDGFYWSTGTNGEKMRITSSGNVGIGTSSPGYKLEVNGGAIGNNIARFTTGGVGGGTRALTLYSDNSQVKLQVTDNVGSQGTWAFLNLNPDGGYVGIGTTSPGSKLTVDSGDVTLTNGNLYVAVGSGNAYSSRLSTALNYPQVDTYLDSIGGSSWEGRLNFRTSSNGGSLTTKMTIIDSGNVGIGTITPTSKLQISGTGRTLNVGSTTDQVVGSFGCSSVPVSTIGFYGVGSSNDYNVRVGANLEAFVAYTADTERMRITFAGNVGIGTTSPGYKLDVYGSPRFYGDGNHIYTRIFSGASNKDSKILIGNDAERFNIGLAASSNTFSINSSNGGAPTSINIDYTTGNVGINTTSPDTKLHIEDVTKVLTNNVAGVAQGTLSLVSTDALTADIGPSLIFGGNYITGNSTRIAYAGITGRKSNSSSTNADGYLSFLTWRSTGLTEAMRITTYGDVCVGTTTPLLTLAGRGNLTINGSSQSILTLGVGDVWKGYLYSDGTNTDLSASGSLIFGTSGGTERMRITTAGNVGIGTTSPSDKLTVQGTIAVAGNGVIGQGSIYGTTGNSSYGTIHLYNGATGNTIINNQSYGIDLHTSGSSKMYITQAGNVGIGTTSPGDRLSVNEFIRFFQGTNAEANGYYGQLQSFFAENTGLLTFRGGGGGGKVIGGANYGTETAIFSDTSEKIRILSNGNVGIGTTSPTQKLSIDNGSIYLNYGNAAANYYLNLNKKTGQDGGILFNRDNANDWQITNAAGNGDLIFYTYGAGSEAVTFKRSNGNVGIGTTTPNTKLSVGAVWTNGVDSTLISSQVDSETLNKIGTYTESTTTAATAMTFFTHPANSSTTEKMRITSTGNVGIGDTDPSDKLVINGRTRINGTNALAFGNNAGGYAQIAVSGATTGNLLFSTYDGAALGERMRISTNGNVGIGTTSPAEKLDVNGNITLGTAGGNNYIQTNGGPNGTAHYYSSGVGNGSWDSRPNANSPYITQWHTGLTFNASSYYGGIRFYNQDYPNLYSSTLVMSIVYDNVGIGTSNPTQKLDVVGSTKTDVLYLGGTSNYLDVATGMRLRSDANGINFVPNGTQAVKITGAGNVGIGTTNPTTKLQVDGGDALINGVTVGRGGSNDDTDTAVGYQALQSQGYGSGAKSTAIGFQALANSTSGYANDAIGFQALVSNITGQYNLAVGAGAGDKIVSGSFNNIIGNSLSFDPIGDDFDGSYTLSIGKKSAAFQGYPQIWSPETITCTDAFNTTILSIDPAIYKAFFMDYCLHDTSNSKAGSFFGTFRTSGGGIAFQNPNINQVTSGTMNDVVIGVSYDNGIVITVQNDAGFDLQADYTVRLILRQ